MIIYEGGMRGLVERNITPRALLQSGGRVYLTVYCYIDHIEKMCPLDRIRELRIGELPTAASDVLG